MSVALVLYLEPSRLKRTLLSSARVLISMRPSPSASTATGAATTAKVTVAVLLAVALAVVMVYSVEAVNRSGMPVIWQVALMSVALSLRPVGRAGDTVQLVRDRRRRC